MGHGKCCTCSREGNWEEFDNGHGHSRANWNVRYDERNMMLQCSYCNAWQNGEQKLFADECDRRFGEGTWEDLTRIRSKTFRKSDEWYEEKIRHYVKESEKIWGDLDYVWERGVKIPKKFRTT